MQFISGKHVARRTFLRGMGATVALPLLDAMVPAGRMRGTASAAGDRTPLVCIEEVHGLAGSNSTFGVKEFLYAPEKVGRDWDLVPANALTPLVEGGWRDYLTIISNTDCRMAEPYTAPEIGGDHPRSSCVFLTQAHPKQTNGSDVYVGISLDQLHAQRFGQDTPLPSMQLCIEGNEDGGGCGYNYACAYRDSISWSSPNVPLPAIRDPRVAFDLLFGVGGTPAARAARRRANSSILDWLGDEVAYLSRQVGASDRLRIEQYLENVREIERRIQMVEAQNTSGESRAQPEAPAGVPDSFEEHMKLMFDLQVVALESDMTRIISFKTGRDAQNRTHPESGSDKSFHSASHHGNKLEPLLDFNKIGRYRLGMVNYFLEKLKNTADGDSNLLEKSLIMWGSPMGDANVHAHRRAPLILLGHANGRLEGNLHLSAPEATPMANVMLSLLHELGHDDMTSFGDSTGEFSLSFPRGSTAATTSSGS